MGCAACGRWRSRTSGNARRRALGELASAGDAFRPSGRGCGRAARCCRRWRRRRWRLEALLERDRHRVWGGGGEAGVGLTGSIGEERAGAGDPEAADAQPGRAGPWPTGRGASTTSGRHEEAAGLLEEAEGLVEEGREPQLLAGIRQGRVWGGDRARPAGGGEGVAAGGGRGGEAGGGTTGARPCGLGGRRARIAAAEGRRGPAEQALRAALAELWERGPGGRRGG